MLGTKALGISLEWRFDFLDHGKTVSPEPGRLYVDLGNSGEPGIIDHHHLECGPQCSAAAIAAEPQRVLSHLLGPLNEEYYRGRAFARTSITFQFTTHREPDWDGAASFYLVDYMIREGTLPPPEVTKALAEATAIIDQGKARIESQVVRPFLLYLMLSNRLRDWGELLIRGRDLIALVIEGAGRNIRAADFLQPWQPPAGYAALAADLEADHGRFEDDLRNSAGTFEIHVPMKNKVSEPAKALYFRRPPESVLFKYWAREIEKPAVLIVPWASAEGSINRVVISIDPHSSWHLPELGYELEKEETRKRVEAGLPRGGAPRFGDGYCDNEDPWYDGRGHDFTIVDSPARGTVLTYDEILACVKRVYSSPLRFDRPSGPLDAFISYRRQGGADTVWALYTRLTSKGKRLFFDIESMKVGPFDEQIRHAIETAKNFILLLTPGALDRCSEKGDWVAEEIRTAMALGKNIIPVMKDFSGPPDSSLPEDILPALRFDGIGLVHEYFEAAINEILEKMR